MRRNQGSPRHARPAGLAADVKRRRVAASLSQSAMAQLAGLSRKTVCRLELTGVACLDSISAIETALGLAPSTLVPDWDVDHSLGGCSPGSRMRRLRKAKGYGLNQLAVLIGLHPSTLSRMERGIGGSEDEWLKVLSDHPFGHYLEIRDHDELEAYLLGIDALHGVHGIP